MSILQRRDEEARKVNRARKIWQAAKRDMRNNRRNARRGGIDRTLEIMSKYEPVLGDGATGGFFSGERASGMIGNAEDHFRDMQRLREQKRMQNQKNIDLLGGGDAGGAEKEDDVFEPDPSFYIAENQTNRGTPGAASLRKPATASSNKADDINMLNEDGTTKGVYSPRKPYVDTVQSNALTRELDKIRRGADAYRGRTKVDSDESGRVGRMLDIEKKYGMDSLGETMPDTRYDGYASREDLVQSRKDGLGIDDETITAINAISTASIKKKLLSDLGIDEDAWEDYIGGGMDSSLV